MNPDDLFHPGQMSDEALMNLITRMIRLDDPIPADAIDTACLIGELNTLDYELANMTFDSYADAAALVVRADEDGRRTVVCESGSLHISIELVDNGQVAVGQVEPGAQAIVVAEGPRDRVSIHCDDRGRFRLELPEGLVRFCIHHQAGSVVTPWLSGRGTVANEG